MTHKGKLRLLALAGCMALAGCGMKSAAEKAVLLSLADPDSAKFGNFYFNPNTKKGCLAVNSKNQMGGYTGEQQAYVQQTDAGWEEYTIVATDLDYCRRSFADRTR